MELHKVTESSHHDIIMYIFFFHRENTLSNDVLDTTFAVEVNSFGVLKVHELKGGGKDIQVTEDNKKEYVR
jgi:Ubiquitin-protein ligase